MTFLYHFQRSSFKECPSVTNTTPPTSQRNHQLHEILLMLVARNLVKYAGITAVLNICFDKRFLWLTADTHSGSGTHRSAMNYHLCVTYFASQTVFGCKDVIRYIQPFNNIQSVQPPHLCIFTFAEAVTIEVGQEHVVSQVVLEHIAVAHHAHSTVSPAVNDECRLVGRLAGSRIDSVQLSAIIGYDKSIT